jgi:hypothetical protein
MEPHIAPDITVDNGTTTIPMTGRFPAIVAIIVISRSLIHACRLSNRTKKQARLRQTLKHATGKQARQTDMAITFDSCSCSSSTSIGRKQAVPTAGKHCSRIIQTDGRSSSPSTTTLTNYSFKSLVIPSDDCSFSPSIKEPQIWQFALSSFGCSYSPFEQLKLLVILIDDCSLSSSIISQFQTKASVDLPLRSAATTTTETPIAAPSSTVADDPTTPLPLTVVVAIANPPGRPTVASAAGPP